MSDIQLFLSTGRVVRWLTAGQRRIFAPHLRSLPPAHCPSRACSAERGGGCLRCLRPVAPAAAKCVRYCLLCWCQLVEFCSARLAMAPATPPMSRYAATVNADLDAAPQLAQGMRPAAVIRPADRARLRGWCRPSRLQTQPDFLRWHFDRFSQLVFVHWRDRDLIFRHARRQAAHTPPHAYRNRVRMAIMTTAWPCEMVAAYRLSRNWRRSCSSR